MGSLYLKIGFGLHNHHCYQLLSSIQHFFLGVCNKCNEPVLCPLHFSYWQKQCHKVTFLSVKTHVSDIRPKLSFTHLALHYSLKSLGFLLLQLDLSAQCNNTLHMKY